MSNLLEVNSDVMHIGLLGYNSLMHSSGTMKQVVNESKTSIGMN